MGVSGQSITGGSLTDGQSFMGLSGFEDDFISVGAFNAALNVTPWVISPTGGVAAVLGEENGVIVMTSGTGSNCQITKPTTAFRLNYGKRLWLGARINVQDIDASSWFVGLSTADTTIVDSLPASVVGFLNTEDDGTIDTITQASSTASRDEQTADIFTADNQWREFKVIWDGQGRLTYFVNGARRQLYTANIPTRTALTFSIEIAAAAADKLWVDFAYAYQER